MEAFADFREIADGLDEFVIHEMDVGRREADSS
jgi:hypothetical protein